MHRHALRRGKQLSARTKRMTRKPTVSKRRNLLEGSRKPASAVKRKIRVLQRLVPNSESTRLDELFEKAAEYIVCLQMQVKVMKIMVAAPSPKDSDC
ncbi:Transcription factor UPBEAT1 [Ananas comosus]|uniref:Transcription factor UPBEAT1 n=1 Tax=Ananas comosus TaxID=4615 RepID=A0A199UDB1_ANACO|nr:Transcription factor UPBEAT1 [Ananas comosus]